MIFSCSNLSKSFSAVPILASGSFRIDDKDKTAIVGINGAGKSTLLKLLVGELTPDSGEIVLSRGKTLGYLAQHQDLASDRTIYEEIRTAKEPLFEMERQIRQLEQDMKSASGDKLAAMMETYDRLNQDFERQNGYACESEIVGVLKGLGFAESEFDSPCATLSGGQKTRVSLGKLLLTRPDCILLDEPTNHLDIASIAWLEGFLSSYPGAVIVVAHDRYFLDRFVDHVIEIENTHLSVFTGNYTAYAAKKKMLRDAAMKQYLNQQQEIKHQEEVIARLKSFNREKSIKRAESREKMLGKTERVDRPQELNDSMSFTLEPHVVSGNDVLTIENLSKSFGENVLFTHANFEIHRGERVAIIGNNGTGKTTLLKIINGLLDADEGACTLGAKVAIGYYDQEQQLLTEENTLFEEIQNAYPYLNNTKIRSTLAAFLFTGDDVFKKVSALSGGERGRLSLVKLILSPCNFLILDEPTNHLDMVSKEILEQALNRYTGTVLYVSHDRYFVNQTATRILELTDRIFVEYIGNYDYYLEKRDALTAAALRLAAPGTKKPSASPSAVEATTAGAADWKSQKEEQARRRKRENDIRKAEDAIAALEEREKEIDALLEQEEIYTNVGKLMELNHKKETIQEEMTEWMERWEALLEE
ncbi:MAG: ABC-F family ATP-binding cassette domain-containing protein [Lachnospiraceae bacterium]|nr:ABC-F family ATP-binding cassette domain-containing protein [Lachnospiraceae bacterium]